MFAPNELIFRRKDMDSRFYYLIHGEVELFIDTPNDKE